MVKQIAIIENNYYQMIREKCQDLSFEQYVNSRLLEIQTKHSKIVEIKYIQSTHDSSGETIQWALVMVVYEV